MKQIPSIQETGHLFEAEKLDYGIEIVSGYSYIEDIKKLIIQYTNELNRDLAFQNFDDELACLDKKYQKPQGGLLAAIDKNNEVIGCVAFRRFDTHRCEMKRLYVLPVYRSKGVGYSLVKSIIEQARRSGYTEMILDTVKPLQSAIAMYKRFGFEEIAPYYDNPMDDAVYMRLHLGTQGEVR